MSSAGARIGAFFAVMAACGLGARAAITSQRAVPVDFARDVRPIIADKCFACHGPDEKHRMAGLRLDRRDSALAKTASGRAAIVPGKPDASELMRRITSSGPLRMPPSSTGKSLTPRDVDVLRRWIAGGAPFQEHWSFLPIRRPALPAVRNRSAVIRNPIDAFVLARLEKEGLNPNPEADRWTLIRRISLDLTGLPPTPEEVDAFVSDRSEGAYEKVVDRLLGSPHFGEKWARPWLDLARYADSSGYGSDPLRPNLWPWRDWVINALNADMPFDQFTIEQIAGDLLPNPTQAQLVATAFHRNTMTNTEGGTDDEEFRVAAVKDRAITTAQVWMGLTLQCAQCHNHKYDPVSQKEFYQLFAFFNQTEDNDQPDERPTLPLPTEEQKAKRTALEAEIAALEKSAGSDPEAKKQLDLKRKELEASKPLAIPIMCELPPEKLRKSHVLVLGNFLQPAEEVEPAVPAAFHRFPPGAPRNRLGLAKWLVSPENPLTARVAVNRIWAQLFGTGIVETEEDFGHQGAFPTHPELLDWLASELMSSMTEPGARSWSLKRLIRLIVTSSTYRRSAVHNPQAAARDPRNRLLARYPRRRLDAETVRDQALALSGLLSRKIGGPSVYPPQPEGLWQAAFNGERTWPTSTGEDRYRRGLYTFWRRTVPYPSMATFDAPSRETCTLRRIPTNTPLQALVTLNDAAYLEMARALARRIVREGGQTVESRARFGLRLVLCRPPSEAQVRTITRLFQTEAAHYRDRPEDAKRLATDPAGQPPDGMRPEELAAWTVAANVLLNLDGVLTKT